jgi:transposase InsO family protein
VNAKVNRWKSQIQHFNFDIEYIPGDENFVADGFSRLVESNQNNKNVTVNDENDDEIHLLNVIVNEEKKLSQENYTKISKVHNSYAGHHGVERTLNKLVTANQTWPKMREHIKQFIKKCPCCQKMSVLKIPIHTHPFTTAAYEPMQRLNIDSIGPLDPDDDGACHIIVVIDCFTRFVELYPVKDTTAYYAARAILNHLGRYGCPSTILSDNGSQYVNSVIKELLKLVHTDHITTLAYSKEENAIVERANKEVVRHLRAIIFDKNIVHQWSICLPFIQRIINASHESSIGTSPASLLFGNTINLDRGIFLPFPHMESNGTFISLSSWSATLIHAQSATIEAAQNNQLKKDTDHIAKFDSRRTEFPIGSYVLLSYPSSSSKGGPPSKLNTNLKGPMKVIKCIGSKYIVENLVTNRTENCHITQLRTFYYDPDKTDPFDAAIRDQFATVVDKIINHKPIKDSYKNQKVSEMSFTVRWKNFSSDYDRELPWKELRNNPALHQYLADSGLYALIPTEHKTNFKKSK